MTRLLGLLVGQLLTAATLVIAAPAHACACGGLVDQPGGDTAVSAETAVVRWDGTRETIALRLSTRSQAVNAGLLVPTPTPAHVQLGDEQMFRDLYDVVQPRVESRWHVFGPPVLFGGGGGEAASAGGPAGLQVLGSVELGPLRATTLAATNAASLDRWLRANHYETSPLLSKALQPYLDEGWSFVAVQLNAVGQTLDGDLPPVSMSFASDRAVYPMRMSSVATESQQPMVYVLAAHMMQRTDLLASASTRPDVAFSGTVTAGQVASPLLKEWLGTTPYLTATSQWLPDPAQIATDFTFAQAPEDAPYQRVLYDDTYMLPGDVGAILILALLITAGWLVVRVLRRPAPTPAPATVVDGPVDG
jgi:hypothetical protein